MTMAVVICTALLLCGSHLTVALRPALPRAAGCAYAPRTHLPRPSSSVSRTSPAADVRHRRQGTELHALLPEEIIPAAFNVATFGPQIPWLLMVLLPNTDLTRKVMGPWITVLLFSLVHLVIVATSISQPDGTAPLAEFAGVFDPSGNPLQAMMGMMKYPNFVSEVRRLEGTESLSAPERHPSSISQPLSRAPCPLPQEWSHVLVWDLFVGRLIWLDGLR